MAYAAYVLTEKSRNNILKMFPPKFPDILAHHATVRFGVHEDFMNEWAEKDNPVIKIVGYVEDESLEALIVTVNGATHRLDGNRFHITLSLDRSKGRKPVDSNALIKSTKWYPLLHYITIGDAMPAVIK